MTTTERAPGDRPPSSRRRCIGAALTLAVLSGSAAALAPSATAAPPAAVAHQSALPRVIDLPGGFRPEGITSGPGTTFYVGSVGTGAIYRGDLRTGEGRLLWQAKSGRSLRGLQYDARAGLLWAVGNIGATSKVWAINPRTGVVVKATTVAGGKFLNDLVVTRTAVWVTDSTVDRLARVALTSSGRPAGHRPSFVPLIGAWPKTAVNTLGANGIRDLGDGQLVLNNTAAGGLFAVSKLSGRARIIPVAGGQRLTSGDGLELRASTLYDVRGTNTSTVSVLTLRRTGAGWRATSRGQIGSPLLDILSTATGSLYAVNARFGTPNPTTATYTVTRLALLP